MGEVIDFTRLLHSGDLGLLSHTEIDTAHFKGNFPESCEMHAARSTSIIPTDIPDAEWTLILPRTKLGPHRQHQFPLMNVEKPFTHVRITIFPDGGIKRVRLFGRRFTETDASSEEELSGESVPTSLDPIEALAAQITSPATLLPAIPALLLTPEAFAPFGQVVQAYPDINAVPSPRTTKITGANQGTAIKFHKLAPVVSSYPTQACATAGLSVYHCQAIALSPSGIWPVKLLERHPCTNQAFIPMGPRSDGESDAGASVSGARYLIIVAQNGEDDRPDLKTLRAFVATSSQGIVYDTGIWRKSISRVFAVRFS